MKVLGIETSCDETAAAIVEGRQILSNIVASQAAIHAPFGGVVPEIASRHHVENLPAVTARAVAEAGLSFNQIDAVAATASPGLLGALLVGLQYAKSLAFALGKPFIGVNHLEGHLHSVFLEHPELDFPFLGLIVSGGHTHLYKVEELGKNELLGATRDDACGEAYDKVAKLLQLGYPGGPALEKIAVGGNPRAFPFRTPNLGEGSLDFSFSGVKTACLLKVQEQTGPLSPTFQADLAASFQEMATRFLVLRLRQAARRFRLEKIVVAGGVAANSALRAKLAILAREENLRYYLPSLPLCTDNGAMIAHVGGAWLRKGKRSPLGLNASANAGIHY